MQQLEYDARKLESLCREYYVERLAVFGSVQRGEDMPDSDLDLLVEFEPDHVPGLFRFFRLQRGFEEIFERRVDLNTPGFLNKAFRASIINNARPIYAG